MKIKVMLEIELDEGWFSIADEEEKLWFENEVMVGDGSLILHSNEIGDHVGVVKSVKIIEYE
jgi:hypothetical protein